MLKITLLLNQKKCLTKLDMFTPLYKFIGQN